VAADAASNAPRRSGAYARSIKPYVTAKGASVGSRLPYAGVVHWGGTIRPRGVPIKFEPHPVISDALDRRTNEIVDDLGDAVDRAPAKRAGARRHDRSDRSFASVGRPRLV
jgi:phage gpG-like protein